MERTRRALRTAQTRFPAIRPAKFAAYNALTRHFGLAMDREFRALARLAPARLSLDVGGNWGQSIAALQRCVQPERIISFEPQPPLAARLAQAHSGDDRIRIEACALGREEGELRLYVPRYGNYLFDGLATTDMMRALTWLGPHTLMGFEEKKLQLETWDVPVRPLDSFGLAPAIVKLDVEGTEIAVIEGGRETFATARPATLVERPTPEVTALLASFGLAPFHWRGGKLLPPEGYSKNTLFLTPEQADRIDPKRPA